MHTPKFDRDQLIFMIEMIFDGALDRIDAVLPDDATDEDIMRNWEEKKDELVDAIGCYTDVVGATIPCVFSSLTDDSMGVGEFHQFDLFEKLVEEHIRQKTHPKLNRDAYIMPPSCHELARVFVDEHFGDYLAGKLDEDCDSDTP